MPHLSSPARDFQQAVALEFAARPRLRQVLSDSVLPILNGHSTTIQQLSLPDAEALTLLIPGLSQQGSATFYPRWSRQPLLETLLDALCQGRTLASLGDGAGDFMVVVAPPYVFTDSKGELQPYGAVSIQPVLGQLQVALDALLESFCQAQIRYWSAPGSLGVSRDQWLQQLLKQALLQNLPLQGLDEQQAACVHGLLQGGAQLPPVCLVEVQLTRGDATVRRLLPNLLLRAERDERQFLLWCSPSSVIAAFDSDASFAAGLQQALSWQHQFDSLTWDCHALEGDVFAQQVAVLLERLLDDVLLARYGQCADVAALERSFAALSDPSGVFIAGYLVEPPASIEFPQAHQQARAVDSFAVQCGLFDLALAQAQSAGLSALEQVQDLRTYTRERLRRQMLEDYPIEANYYADDLDLTLTRSLGVPGGEGTGTGDGVTQTRKLTLTEFAIGNLASLEGWVLTSISHGSGQLIMGWMTPDYVKGLVERVDIGGHYPGYVKSLLDAPATRDERCRRFAREWRCSLLFSALGARLDGSLSENGLQCVVDYCRGRVDARLPEIMLMPLAFAREPGTKVRDRVHGMFVLFAAERETVLLYRPLYPAAALTEFANLKALMAAIREQQALQDSILTWLTPEARKVYDHGGFSEPHLGRPIVDTSTLPEPVKPATFAASFWRTDVDEQMYLANRDLLVELADRESTSTAESRWAILKEGAWLVFQAVNLLLRGPVATVAWLVQGVLAVEQDVQALREGDAFERSSAVVDLLLNAAMVLMHARLPGSEPPAVTRVPEGVGFDGLPVLPSVVGAAEPRVTRGSVGLPGPLPEKAGRVMDFSWRGVSGSNVLTPQLRTKLMALRANVDLESVKPDASGLYPVAGKHYVPLAGHVFQVEASDAGVRVVSGLGEHGPWVVSDGRGWCIDTGLHGGMMSRVQKKRADREAVERKIRDEDNQLASEAKVLGATLQKHSDMLLGTLNKVQELEQVPEPDALQLKQLEQARQMVNLLKEKAADDLKAVIDNYLEQNRLSARAKAGNPSAAMAEAIKVQRNTTQHQLIEYFQARYNYLTDLINAENMVEMAKDILINPRSDAEVATYRAFRAVLQRVAGWETQLVDMSVSFDEVLADCIKDDALVFTSNDGARVNKDAWLKDLIRQRGATGIDLQAHLLKDLGELSIDRLADTDELILKQAEHALISDDLRSALAAHGEVPSGELDIGQRTEVLTSVLETYAESEAAALLLTETGGEIIQLQNLLQYRKVLVGLVDAAERELANCVQEQHQEQGHDQHQARPQRPVLYRPRGGRRHVVRTSKGRSVVGVEAQRDGATVLEQRGDEGQLLKTFRQQGQGWVEETPASAKESLQVDIGKERGNARRLLDKVESVIALAKQYLQKDQPVGLTCVIEGHVERLKESLAALPRTEKEQPLLDRLQEGIERLETVRGDLLTSLYLTTSNPTAASLRFLVEQGQVTVQRAGRRKALAGNDYLDVYEVRRIPAAGKAQGVGLWEVHFHYPAQDTPGRSFSKGHLKLWSQRKLGRQAQFAAAGSQGVLLAIYRGDLRMDQVEGIIPFD
ncbi:dermonecrotic toxin domain-containing protein [Pseudomonas sp. NPDC089406]|uniref:dermonecrotic toxin domain-containing protein n=1 Tax=Pseudomonas sp. NPDC089406 TaxID=3364463 RepID=UPI00384F63E4